MAKETSKGQNYLHGAAIMTAGVVLIKILGAIYKIPLGNMLGDDGYGLFLSAYNVYAVFLTLGTAGFPVALSRMISSAYTQGRPMQERRTYRVALCTFIVMGTLCASVMLFYPSRLASLMNNPDTDICILVLAPSVLLCCIAAAFRGLTQGHGDMIPTTMSQIIDVLAKVATGLTLAAVLLRSGMETSVAAAGAILGVTAGAAAALLYMVIIKRKRYRFKAVENPDIPDSSGEIFKNLVRIGVPIALGSIVLSLLNMIDSGLCMGRLQNAAGYDYHGAKVLYGVYGKAQTLFNLPAAFITPLTVAIVPAIAAEIVRKNKSGAAKISEDSLRIGMAVSLPMGIGLSVLSYPIMKVLYADAHESGAMLLGILGVASVFVSFSMISTAVLQASGRERLTVYSVLVGGAVKIAINWVAVGIPGINIYGAAIGTVFCNIAMCAMNLIFIRRSIDSPLSLRNIFLRPALPTAIMGVSAFAVYKGVMLMMPSDGRLYMVLSMLSAIAIAVIVYALAVTYFRAITEEDMALIPKGEKIAKLLIRK